MKKGQKQYNGKNYRELQSHNKKQRQGLSPPEQQQLKKEGYKNLGWKNVIALWEKLQEIQLLKEVEETTLESLFIDATRIGRKYLTDKEMNDFYQELAQVNQEISDQIDEIFSDS